MTGSLSCVRRRDFKKNVRLLTGKTIPVELLPEKPGEHEFAWPKGMFRGRPIVE